MLILVTGGSRSGKSGFALQRAREFEGPRIFLATAQPFDEEMAQRIAAHQRDRPAGWELREEPIHVPDALASALQSAHTVIIDCVTVWMANLLLADDSFDEVSAAAHAGLLVSRARAGARTAGRAVIVVTNEVGSGIVPDNAISRRFRDCAGRANQVIAREADEVYSMVCGIPFRIKPQERQA
ncbi:MAG TPA: bifunctional adenosylcobinamide kinase/adenosylcobinamide-phosphate guanylyltransferase [Spirochaetia bacterium]|nr:bifunctional adenosylcobinamide kinase/adenosylcobinamide-phosphate guanylyltransferase [Spirochaetia bacterium]